MYYSLTVLQATFDNAPAEPGHALLLAGLVLGSVPDQKKGDQENGSVKPEALLCDGYVMR